MSQLPAHPHFVERSKARALHGRAERSGGPRRRARGERSRTELKGSVGEGPNQTNYLDRSSVRILGIQRIPRKAPPRKKPLQRSSIRPEIQEGAARNERKGKQTALRERGVRRPRTDSKEATSILAFKRCYACLQRRRCLPSKYDRSAFRSVKMRIECQD